MSFFFNNTGKANKFFDWQADVTTLPINLGILAAVDMAIHNMIEGYIGSDTMPTCTALICWYIIDTPFDIKYDYS